MTATGQATEPATPKTLSSSALALELAHFTGTELWHRHGLARSVTYTDGVKYFADNAGGGAYWFLDILATELPVHLKREGFLGITMEVIHSEGKSTGSANLTADDGNGKIVWSRKIGFTDAPAGTWTFFMAPGGPGNTMVIMLRSEW